MLMRLLAASLGLCMLAAGPLTAQQTPAPPSEAAASPPDAEEGARSGGKGRGRLAACRADIAAHCAGAERNGRMRCLRDNQAKLSPACLQSIEAGRMSRKELRQACAVERETICASTGKGRGGLSGCLKQNASRLSEACATALAALPAGRDRDRSGSAADRDAAPAATTPPPPTVR